MCISQACDWVKWRKKLPRESELPTATASTQPAQHNKTSSREFNFTWSQAGSVPRRLSQINTNPQPPSGGTGLESSLTAPQTLYILQGSWSMCAFEMKDMAVAVLFKRARWYYIQIWVIGQVFISMCIPEVLKQLKAWPLLTSCLLTICLGTQIPVSISLTSRLFCQLGYSTVTKWLQGEMHTHSSILALLFMV